MPGDGLKTPCPNCGTPITRVRKCLMNHLQYTDMIPLRKATEIADIILTGG